MHRKAWTWSAVALLVLGVALFATRPQEVSYVFTSSDPQIPPGFYWLPRRALLGVSFFVVGLVGLAATTAYAAGVRKGRSTAN